VKYLHQDFNNKFHGGHTYFPPEIKEALSLAPYLNGGLFIENKFDQEYEATISDRRFEQVLKFLERYNFTIAEDSPLDQEVAVDPEMIGKVYESLVNISEEVDKRGEAGIFYTPRTEIDLMCRLSLVDYLTSHLGEDRKELLYQLVFALESDEKADADKAVAGIGLWPALSERLHGATLLDPACGSGSSVTRTASMPSSPTAIQAYFPTKFTQFVPCRRSWAIQALLSFFSETWQSVQVFVSRLRTVCGT